MKRRAFTLTEVMVVIAIIVLILGLAVPAFKYVTGQRSIDMAQNQLAAIVGRARSEAVAQHRPVGVCIYRDPVTDRTGCILVMPSDAEPFDSSSQYISASDIGAAFTIGGASGIQEHESYVWMAAPSVTQPQTYWVCTVSNGGGFGPTIMPPNTYPGPSPNWSASTPWSIRAVPDTEAVYLSVGIGAQVLVDARQVTANATDKIDRFVRTGVIMFDERGHLSAVRYVIDRDSRLGKLIGLNQNNPAAGLMNESAPPIGKSFPSGNAFGDEFGSPPAAALHAGYGVVLYDLLPFRDQGYKDQDVTAFSTPDATALTLYRNGSAGIQPEQKEEAWLDANGLVLMVNRYSGTLLRQE